MVKAAILERFPEINHFFLDKSESSADNFLRKYKDAVSCGQVHGNKITGADNPGPLDDFDGLFAGERSILAIRTADCLPVFFYASGIGVILALHAGWRGLVGGIIKEALKKIFDMKALPGEIFVAIGPHIGACCYRVGGQFVSDFFRDSPADGCYKKRNGGYYLDLGQVARNWLLHSGIPPGNIEDVGICTFCGPGYNSWRRDQTDMRNLNFIEKL